MMRSCSENRFVVMMVKRPKCGAVKSRLAADLGTVAATSAYRTMMYHSIRKLSCDTRWTFVLSITPDNALYDPVWPDKIPTIPQGNGGLGTKMHRIMTVMPPGKVVIIGSDVAGIKPDHLAAAFKKLGSADAVFAPADDGGYSLVGLKRVPRIVNAFENVRWSSPNTLNDTLRNLDHLKIAYIEELPDIDTGNEWEGWNNSGKAGRLCF